MTPSVQMESEVAPLTVTDEAPVAKQIVPLRDEGVPIPPPFGEPIIPPMFEEDAQTTRIIELGIASWYHDRRTASGEPYRRTAYTAAHRSLPFGTRVNVRNLENGREVVVRITDRGPFVRGRIIDLSEAAARKIGLVRSGIARVELEVLSVP